MNGSPEGLVGETDNVKVAVRCRPLSTQETTQGHLSSVDVDDYNNAVTVVNPGNKEVSSTANCKINISIIPGTSENIHFR